MRLTQAFPSGSGRSSLEVHTIEEHSASVSDRKARDVFTTAHPHVATPLGGTAVRDTIGGKAKRIGATATALALGGAFALAAPFSASAADVPESYAEGQFLSGTLLGFDLTQVLAIESAEAWNDGTQPSQTDKDPLDADVLQDIEIAQEEAPQVDLGGVLQIGPVAQYAQALMTHIATHREYP